MDCVITDAEIFDIITKKFTEELYEWMKIEFSDVCSHGDVCINKLLDDLNTVYNIKNKIEISSDIKYINYIYNTYINNYLQGKKPDPW
jgi:hypothetical protein